MPDPARSGGRLDVYLLPAVVGGGLGDVDEVLCAGRALARAGFPPILYRRAGAELPSGVAGPWTWPTGVRRSRLRPRAARALTVAPAWGVSCAPARDEPFGRAGPWSEEAAEIERTYGTERTVHVSLEEFARALTARQEARERLREGGVRSRELARQLGREPSAIEAYRAAYRKFRAFDRENVLHLYAGFRYDRAFSREYPEAVQTGPLWPGRHRPRSARPPPRGSWVWYASPASAEAIAPSVVAGLRRSPTSARMLVRTPRRWATSLPASLVTVRTDPIPAGSWRTMFDRAPVRVVTGSRSLLEALEVGGPFLYFNGVLGRGSARRRHRPEKIVSFLSVARSAGWPLELLADLADFSRGRRVRDVVARVAVARGAWGRFPSTPRPVGFPPGYEDAGAVLVRCARRLAEAGASSREIVRDLRVRSNG